MEYYLAGLFVVMAVAVIGIIVWASKSLDDAYGFKDYDDDGNEV